MKTFLTALIFISISTLALAQDNYQDVVYLKNGTILRGIIIEQVPKKSLKIETADGSVFVHQMDEVEKITKELAVNKSKITGSGLRADKGYIGLTLGASIPVGELADGSAKTGFRLNLINFGYLFSSTIGITANWFGVAHPVETSGFSPLAYGGITIGPLFSFPVAEKIKFDLRPMFGYSLTTLPSSSSSPDIGSAFSVAFDLGTNFRFDVGKKVSLLLCADYFSSKPKFEYTSGSYKYNYQPKIGTVALCVGVAVKLK